MLPALPRIDRLGTEGAAALEHAAVLLQVPPAELAAAVSIESGFNTRARNPDTGATGLIQWTPATAAGLGTTTDEIADLSAVEQAALIVATLQRLTGRMVRSGDVYVAIVQPAHLDKPDSFVWARKGESRYDRNAGLDVDHDDALTVGDLRARVARELAKAGAPSTPRPSSSSSFGEGFALLALLLFALWRARA